MKKNSMAALMLLGVAAALPAAAQSPVRARDLGIPFDGVPGALNAITDVGGIEVGYATRIEGEGKLVVGKGPIRTGVTVLFPRGRNDAAPVYGGWFAQNGNGEMTGTTWLEESGFLEGPIAITNTHSVGVVRDSIIAWSVAGEPYWKSETRAEPIRITANRNRLPSIDSQPVNNPGEKAIDLCGRRSCGICRRRPFSMLSST